MIRIKKIQLGNSLNALTRVKLLIMLDKLKDEEEKEANGSTGKYLLPEVLEMLIINFHKKCYICENIDSTSYEIEHFHSKLIVGMKYNWNNLLLSCAHCNSTKKRKPIISIINCTDFTDPDPITELKFDYMPIPRKKVEVTTLSSNPKTLETVLLLNRVFTGGTSTQKEEARALADLIRSEIRKLLNALEEYYEAIGTTEEAHFRSRVLVIMSSNRPFTGIKYSYLKGQDILSDFEADLDFL
ncbi:hypothetical protein A9Q84_00155 [Halobacteriovorax marinus]|uniref:HNH domain-containing protein n=1 Tax=Halobacteriovorax marinus TaxID=97084 RepID=A0A1Y5FD27_9BACT|nr:hypothetical protein A9Q84_00155 [Halobacteriovorax marinus]